LNRVTAQLLAGYGELEAEIARTPLPPSSSASMHQAGVTLAVAWHFTQQMVPDVVPAERFARLAAYSTAAEALPEFKAAPHGEGTYLSP
jgi:hypothetical protein